MKTKGWVALLGSLLAVCAGLSLWLLQPREAADRAEIWSDGILVETVSLSENRELRVEGTYGTNVIAVKDGKIAVTEADCPDHYCIRRGFCHSGAQIVCLPNRLVIKFVRQQSVDGVAG